MYVAGAGRARDGRAPHGCWRSGSTGCPRRWPRRSSAPRWRWRTTGPRADAAFAAALAAPARNWWRADYGTALRDQAAIALLLKESGLAPDRLQHLLAAMPGADLDPDTLSTQEQAWAAAAAAVLGRDGHAARIALDGKDLPAAPVLTVALSGPARARNLGDHPVWQSVSVTGVPATPLPAARSGMRISRQFFNLDGSPLDLDHLKQNTVFVLLLEGRAEDGQPHRAMVQHGLPAGWEIAGRIGGGDAPGLSWLGKLSRPEAQPAADDRYAAVVELTPDKPDFRAGRTRPRRHAWHVRAARRRGRPTCTAPACSLARPPAGSPSWLQAE